MKRIIHTSKAPRAIGPYSQAIEINGTLYVSGQIPVDASTGKLVDGGIREQTEQCLRNTGYILEQAGYSFADVVKSTCLLADISLFSGMNEVYARFYPNECPTRATYAVKALPANALVEIETIAIHSSPAEDSI